MLCQFDPMARMRCHMDYGFPTCDKIMFRHVSCLKSTLELVWTIGSVDIWERNKELMKRPRIFQKGKNPQIRIIM